MSTNNIGFYEDLTKLSLNYHQISSNTHVISSAEYCSMSYVFKCQTKYTKNLKQQANCKIRPVDS